ncbi:MAG: non-ribosomal peptide synthetase [Bryobacteraceae bacterium]|nr:non-ribosomal peptide synthetase [Bryobacteraceae bacterium]
MESRSATPTRIQPGPGFRPFSKREIEQSIASRFERQANEFGGRLAVKTRGDELTYRELNAFSNRVAQTLLEACGPAPQAVALLFEQGATLIASVLGTLKAGKRYVALDPTYPRAAISRMLAHSEAGAILADGANDALARELAEERPAIRVEPSCQDAAAQNPALDVEPDAPAYLFYTSGSTGQPKGVIDSHRNVLHNILRYTNTLGIGAGDRLTLLQSCSFSGSVSSLFAALLNGAASYPLDPRLETPAGLARWVNENRLTMWHSTPALFRHLCDSGEEFPSLRVVRLEGDKASRADVERFRRHCSRECLLVNGLGTTETGIVRQYFIGRETPVEDGAPPIGYAVEDMDVTVLDDDGRELEPGAAGEIAVTSRYLALGYWKQPELTAERFQVCEAGPPGLRRYRTGDLGRMRPDGCLGYLGRKDFRAKIAGYSVEAADIEAALCAQPEIGQAVVAAREDGAPARLVAYLVASGRERPAVERLRERLARQLPAYMVPSSFVFLDTLPLDRNGKVDRRNLPVPERQRPAFDTRYETPSTDVERRLAAAWTEALGIDGIGIDDDFFALGGQSLDVMRVASEIGLPVSAFFETPTIRGLAARMDRRLA